MPPVRHIALLMGQELGYCRGVLRGVQAYAISHPNWVFRVGPPDQRILKSLRGWKLQGVIAHLFTDALARPLARMRCPVVSVTQTLTWWRGPLVDVDHVQIGRLAADHFLDRGFRRFGYFGSQWTVFSKRREQGFRERLAEAEFSVSSCYAEYLPRQSVDASWRRIDTTIRRWLESLPRPVAIFASNDVPARDLADICRQLKVRVPEDVAILGVDDDPFECNLARPPLSSVANPAQAIGYEAARMLDQLMSGKGASRRQIALPATHIVTRQSTDTLAVEDPHVAGALEWIRRHATERIGVDHVMDHVTISRRNLERRFGTLLNRTILDEIRHVRMMRVKQLLIETDLQMPAIAERCGFTNAQRMSVVFSQFTGMAPTTYRRLHRPGET